MLPSTASAARSFKNRVQVRCRDLTEKKRKQVSITFHHPLVTTSVANETRKWFRKAIGVGFSPGTDVEREALRMLTQTQNKIELLKPQEVLTKSLDRTAELLQQGWLKDNNGSHVRVLAGEPGCYCSTKRTTGPRRSKIFQRSSLLAFSCSLASSSSTSSPRSTRSRSRSAPNKMARIVLKMML